MFGRIVDTIMYLQHIPTDKHKHTEKAHAQSTKTQEKRPITQVAAAGP